MSLQVWLPLTKDLRQQGLSDATVTNNGATFNSAGKLGGCYSFSNNTMILPSFSTTRSISLWLKTTLTNSTIAFVDYKSKLGFGFQSNGYIIANCGNTSFKMFSNTNFQSGQWNHIVVTRDDGLTDVALYINGILQTERINTNNTWTNNVDGCYIGGRSTGTNMTCFINDFRVYDHCLSSMEVKQLSQGLVLHYPLNNKGCGNDNLLKNQYLIGDFTNQSTLKAEVSCWANDLYNSSQLQSILQPNTTYTFSFNVELIARTDVPTLYSRQTCFLLYSASTGSANRQIGTTLTNLNEFKTVAVTFTTPNTIPNDYRILTYTNRFTTNGSAPYGFDTFRFTGIKLEEGEQATPYCPNVADESYSNIEYDNSGFCNNGTRITNTITHSLDTAKYIASTHFNGTYDGILIENLALKDIINSAVTYAFWIKPESESGARSVYFGSYSTGPSWSIEKTTGNVIRSYWNGSPDETCTGATITDGVWQHICLTKNGTNDIKVYINGVQKWASTATHSNLSFPTTYRIGRDTRSNDGTPYKGLMCDFRIYATALSADDVKSLYQNCATIDPDGTIRGQIRS